MLLLTRPFSVPSLASCLSRARHLLMPALSFAIVASFFVLLAQPARADEASPSLSPEAESGAQLYMFESAGCYWCQRWHAEIGPSYDKTREGKAAPLMRRDITSQDQEPPRLARKIIYTPTFVLVRDGQEVDRLEGYPGEDFFWPVLTQLLTRARVIL